MLVRLGVVATAQWRAFCRVGVHVTLSQSSDWVLSAENSDICMVRRRLRWGNWAVWPNLRVLFLSCWPVIVHNSINSAKLIAVLV